MASGADYESAARLALDFGAARDLQGVFDGLRRFVLERTPSTGLFVSLYDEQTQLRTCRYAWSDGAEVDCSTLPPLPITDSPHSRAVKTGEVVLTDDFDKAMVGQPRVDLTTRDPRLPRSSLVVPMVAHGRVVGAVELQSLEPAAFRPHHIATLSLVANLAGLAIENTRLTESLERKVRERTRRLEEANRELEAFSYTVAHDLKAPLMSLDQLARAVVEDDLGKLNEPTRRSLGAISKSASRMSQLVQDLLVFARSSQGDLVREDVNLSAMARAIAADLRAREPEREAEVLVEEGLAARGDPRLVRIVVTNLLENAWKFSRKKPWTRIEVGKTREPKSGESAFFVRDHGAGFDPARTSQLFQAFRRLHGNEYEGTGIGLATVSRIVERHGGRVWAEGRQGEGATFAFTLPSR